MSEVATLHFYGIMEKFAFNRAYIVDFTIRTYVAPRSQSTRKRRVYFDTLV